MRARYYLADPGVFLADDPVKNIGPGWKPIAYGYALGNPSTYTDPQGTSAVGAALSFADNLTSLLANQRAAIQNDIGPNEWLYNTSSNSASLLGGGPILEGISSGLTAAVEVRSEGLKAYLVDELKDELFPGRHIVENLNYLLTGKNLPESLRAPNMIRQGGGSWLAMANSIDRAGNAISAQFSGNQFSSNGGSFAGSTPATISSSNAGIYATNTNKMNASISASPINTSGGTSSSPSGGAGGSSYTIRSGDTLSAIAARSGTTVAALASANGISNVNMIYAGASITVPSKPSTGSSSSGKASTGKK